jgi:predicted nuclease of restriction endonuclease-like (RecB) superfamily
MQEIINTKDYISFLDEIKRDIQNSRIKAHLSVNKELILLYWRIGKEIINRKKKLGWGSEVISLLSQDLKAAFPDMKGFGVRTLEYMQTFAKEFTDLEFPQQAVAEIPWGHIICILDKVKNKELKLWYIKKTIENGWSRNVLLLNINSESHLKIGTAQTNFHANLPKPQSDLAQELIKSEYNFDFLGLSGAVHEKEIENGLIDNIKHFLLELGSGFAFLGSQYRVKLAGEEFFIDLLMYHVKLKSYVVLELKAGEFKPEYAGKLSFYLTAIDREIKDENDNPTIGILLCQSSNKLMVEYCLQDLRKPIGVSEYVTKKLPKNMEEYLPSPAQFQHIMKTSSKNEGEK